MSKTKNEAFAESYRSLAGLPKRTSNAPRTNGTGEASDLDAALEPKGGYGGKDGIDNAGSMRRTAKQAASGTDLVGTELGKGKTDGGKTAKKSIAAKKAVRKQAKGPVTGAK